MERRNPFTVFLNFPFSLLAAFAFKKISISKVMIGTFLPTLESMRKWGIVCIAFLSISLVSRGQVNGDYQTRATGNWNANTTWQVYSAGAWNNCLAGDYPGVTAGAGTINILNGNVVTLNLTPANPVGALTFAPGNIALSSVVFGGNWTLDVTGAVTYTLPGNNNNGDQTLNVATGTLNCSSVTMVTTGNNNRVHTLSLSTGTVNVTGDVTMAAATQNTIIFTGAGVLNIGGNFVPGTGTFTPATGTVNYNGAAQNVAGLTYNDLTISGTSNKTIQGNIAVNGTLTLTSGTFEVGARTLTLNGPSIAGTPANLVTTAASSLIFGGTTAGVLIPSSIALLNGLSITNTSVVALQSSPTISGVFNPTGAGLSIGANTLTLNGQINCGTLVGGATSNIVIGGLGAANLSGVALNNLTINRNVTMCGSVAVGGTLTLTSGVLTIAANTLTLSDAGVLTYVAGTLTGGVTSNLVIGTGADITLNTIANGLNNFTSNRNIILGANLSLNGTLTLTAGTFTVGTRVLTLNGPAIAGTPGNLVTVAASSLIYGGSSAGVFIPASVANLNNLTINNANGVTMNSNISLAVGGVLTLTNGLVQAGANILSITNTNPAGAIIWSPGSFVNVTTGGLERTLAPNLVGTANNFLFPIGEGGVFKGINLREVNTGITGPVLRASVSATGALTGDGTTIGTMDPRYWSLINLNSGNLIRAKVELYESGLNLSKTIGMSPAVAGNYVSIGGSSNTPSIISPTVLNPGPYFAIGAGILGTYYSFQTGNWNTPDTWTSDPSGTLQIGSTIPADNDKVIILTGRTVSLPADISTQNLDITIDAGGFLNQNIYRFINGIYSLRGQGTIKLASANFPASVINTFINAGGGTTEYDNTASFTLPAAQTIYNNLTINTSGFVATLLSNVTLNGNLDVKSGTFQINNNVSAAKLTLTINKNVTVDNGAFITVGNGVTNPVIGGAGGIAPFLNYYLNFHTVIIRGDFTNNGSVRFTNLPYPIYNAFPPIIAGPSSGAASVYFQGASDNTLTCNGVTDFYNLILDKGIDQTYKLTVNSTNNTYFKLFGANSLATDGGVTSNPNIRKALWIRTGTLVLNGSVIIPSLTEGTAGTSDYYIPANGAMVINGVDVAVLSSADDYREINTAYSVAAPNDATIGVTKGGVSAMYIFGKLQIDNGFLSTRESGGLITSNVASGQFIINGGTVDSKQLLSSTGFASYTQTGGIFILRGRFQRTPLAYSTVGDLTNVSIATLNTSRALNSINTGFGSFNLEQSTNIFTMSGGTIRIYDVCGIAAGEQKAFDVKSSSSNFNVTGGTLEIIPTTGIAFADATNYFVNSSAPLYNIIINRNSSASFVSLSAPLTVLNDLSLTSGDFNANNFNVSVGRNFTIDNGTSYTTGTNTTILNGIVDQVFTVNLAAPLSLNKFTIDKPAGIKVDLAGSQNTINVNDNLRLILGTLNDNGKTINVSRDVYNSGLHNGAGKIVLNGTLTQSIDGNGIFQNVELNNTNAAASPVSLAANMTVNGVLTFSQDKLFNIGAYNLKLNPTASFSNASATRYVQTAGNAGDGGVTKVFTGTAAFLYPVGAPTITPIRPVKYTPVTIGFSSAPAVYGSITVVPVGYEHPSTTINGQSLTYFWRIKSAGFSGIAPNSVTHSFVYDQSDVAGTEANYIPALYTTSDFTWRIGTNANPPIDITNNLITDWTTPTNSTNYLDADYTAGDAAFGAPQIYYSRQSGLWGTLATWSLTGHSVNNPPAVPPGINDIVIIGGQDSVYLATNNTIPNTDVRSCASLQIESGSALDIGYNFNSNFGMVMSHPNGNGNFRLTTSWTSGNTFTFPLGDFSDFNVNLGTTELYSTNPAPGTTYWLPNGVLSYGNLIISPLGGSNIIFANNDLTIYGNLITRGQNADSWFCPTWNVAYPNPPTVVAAKTITINGNMNIQGGALIWYGNGAIAQNIVVNGNVIVAPLTAIDNLGGGTNQRLSIGGNLINNANGLVNAPSGTRAWCNFTNIPVTFFGSTSASITNTTGTPSTVFGQLVINKGTTQATTFTCNIGGTLTTPADNWLTLQNGTFRFMRTDPGTDFTISTTTPFTIPSTAGLSIDYSNANNRNILIGNTANNSGDLLLSGKLTLVRGNVYVGPVAAPANNNDIEYSGSGASTIEIQGGNLVVNGQIRRNTSTTNGILNYTQTGGIVTINGNAAVAGYAKLEILNSGSGFNMSGGTLSIIRGGGTTFGDLYLRPASSSVTGGTIIFSNVIPNTLQNYLLDANIPLNNLTITGAAGAGLNANLGLNLSPLVLNGTLTLGNAQSIFTSNNINVSIKGDMDNSGTYNFGTNTTTFNGGVQNITGSLVTNFYNLNVSSTNSLTVNRSFTVNQDLFIGSGTFTLGNKKVTLLGNLVNNSSYTDDNTTGGLSLSGTTQQQIAGTGFYGKLEIKNSSGAKLNNDIMLQNDLVLTQGIFDINSNLLTLSQFSNILGVPGVTKMIMSDGVTSSFGLRKFFTASPQTFTFPIGVAGKYTPATFTITANGAIGYINVNPIDNNHPSVLDPMNVLKYYWKIESSGISGFDGTVLLQYLPTDVSGVESEYVAARLELPGNFWYKAPTGPLTDNVNEATHQITFNYSGSSNLNGDYTAGRDNAIPGEVPTYQTNSDGNWSDAAIWTPVGSSPLCPAGGPNGSNVIIDHVVTTNINNIFVLTTIINNELRVVSPSFGHNLGIVSGNGTIYLENGNLPGGNYASFIDCSGNGTIEYGGTGTYTIIATQFSSLPNMFISGTGTRILPNIDLTICKRLIIDGATLDNSVNNRKLTILGTMERYNTGVFTSGTGNSPASTVSFAGIAVQNLGGGTGNFTGANKFNNLEINNFAGLNINGLVEVNNELLLSNGIINTTSANKLTLLNTSSSAVVPAGGNATSFVNGPLIKQIINGGNFLYPIGKGTTKGHNFTLTSSAGSTLFWTVEYFTPNPTATSLTPPLQVSNTKEYWSVNTSIATTAKVKIGWDPMSDLTPLMTLNGIADMRVAEFNAGSWTELTSTTSGDNNNGDVSTTNNVNISTIPKNYTTASVTSTIARALLSPAGPVCGASGIPVSFTSFNPILLNYTLDYRINGVAQPTLNVTSLPYTLPTPVPGAYRLTGFTYNNGANTGVVDGTVVNVYASPTPANAGLDQSLCGISGLVLAGNSPAPYSGLWTIVSGAGGTFVNSTQYNTVFTGVLGVTYTLRWTISNVTCSSSDDVVISFPVVASIPSNFMSAPAQVCQGSSGYVYSVPNVLGVTYNWTYTGLGATINGTGNSVTIDFNSTATSGTLNVTATNACGTSAPRSVAITVNTLPSPSIVGSNNVCPNSTGIIYSTTNNPGNTYNWLVSGGVINGSSTGNSITVDWGASGTGTVRVTETRPAGCTFTTLPYNVLINDIIRPAIVGCPSNISVNNDPGVCSAVVNWIEPTATDNCTAAGSLVWTKSHLPGAAFPVGTTVVTYTATDAFGNTSLPCTFNVIVTDNTSPVITLPAPPIINADAICQATVPVIAATATDNCSIPANITISQVPLAGTIIGAGVTVVTVTATDQAGNSAVSNINVTVVDVTKPIITPPADPTINLDNNCQTIVPNFLPALIVSDNCTPAGAIIRSQNPAAGTTISGVGVTNVKIYATDASGNMDSVTVMIVTHDVTPPVMICRNVNLYLDGSGNATLTPAQVNNGSTDNCTAVLTYFLSKTNFDCSNIGAPVPVTFTGTDASGNSSSCISQVTVLDTVRPVVNVRSFTLVLGATGTGTVLPSDVDNGSFDNCGAITLAVTPNTFNCGDQGPQNVTLTATDSHGNSSSRSVQIIVGTSLTINSVSLNTCDVAAPFALYASNVTGGSGSGTYTYFWDGLEDAVNPFMSFDAVPPFIHFSNTSTVETPFFNNTMPDGIYHIRLIVTDGNGCVDTSEMVLNKLGLLFNNVTLRYTTACEGQTKTYSVAFDATATYTWNVTNGVFLTPTNTNTVDVRWNMGATQGVLVANTTKPDLLGNPCGSSVVDTVTINSIPLPAFNSPVISACSNSQITYTLSNTYTTHTWTITGGVITGGGTAGVNFVTVRWGIGPVGRVSVTVENASICTNSTFVDVSIFNLQGSITAQSNITCNGLSNGSVTVAATAGTGLTPYEYSLDGGAFQASGTFNSLTLGNHTVQIRDALLCTFDIPVTITEPSVILGSVSSQTNVSCNGGSDGSATISASGGVPAYDYNIDGGAFQASATFNGLSAGAHNVTIRDANLCTKIVPVSITQPAALSGSIAAQTNIDCNGNSTGSVTILGTGGTPGYQYSLDGGPYQGSGSFNALSAGFYVVTVRDSRLCTFNVNVTITQPVILTGSISSQVNVSCFGGSNGQVTVAGSGGTLPYQYRLDGGGYQLVSSFVGISAGLHNVTIRDGNLCTAIVPVNITQPAAALTVGTSQVNVACFGGSTGTATAIPAGGTAPYTYSWNTLPVQTTITATGLTAGTYTVTVTDANLCTATANVTITQPAAALTIGTSQVNVACFGGATGTATAIPAGGTAPYTYSWNTLPVQTTITATGLIAGTYTVTVTDANLCTATANVTITQPAAALTVGTSQVNVACFAGATGTATAIPAGGTAPYTYSWNTLPVQTTITATGLTAGTYTVTVTDANLCTATANVTITQPAAALTVGTSQVNVACFAGATGTATAIPAGGTAPYTYSWNTLPVQTTITATGLTAGTYTVTVTDANLCTATANVTITQPAAALTVGTSQVNVACFAGATGTATAIPSGGTAPYTYSWNTLPVQTTITATGLIAGTYTVTVTDANLCTATANVTITQPAAALTVGTSQVNVACFAGATGTATAIPAGGTAPYTYSWNTLPVQTTLTATGLIAGTYTVTVTDANLCTATANVTITQPAAALTVGTSQVNVACFAGATGTATAIPAGGTAPYTYSWNTLPVQTTITATGLTAGTYTVTVTDANLCTATANVTITQPAAALTVGTSQVNVACFAGATGTATAIPAGGTAPYTYSWNTLPVQTTITATGLIAGTYTVTVTDANLCTATANVTITQPAAALTVGTSQVNVACFAGATGTATAIPAGGTAPYTYSWNTLPVQTTITATGLTAGTYTVTVTDANLCTATANVIITQPAAALTVGTSQVNVACFGGSTGTATAIPAGGTAPYTYSWNTLPVQTTITATGLTAGTYTVTVTDANLCTATANVTITQPAAALTIGTSQVNVACFAGATGTATAIPAGGTAPYTYSWNTLPVQTTITATGLTAGTYTVTVTDANLCTATANVTITQPAAALTVGTSQVNVACFAGATGTATAIPAGGTAPYTYSWNTLPVQTTITATGLIAGTYTVTVTDANLCTATANVTITQPATGLSGVTVITNVACFGDNTGAVNLTVSGGTAPYTFLWSNSATTEDLNNVVAGNYTVTITDAAGCTANASGIVTQPAVLTLAISSQTNIACFGDATGSVTVGGVGGTGPYQYRINAGGYQVSGTFSGLTVGSYSITVRDANLCTTTVPVTITQPASALSGFIISQTGTTCFGDTDGSVTVSGSGGTTPYQYNIDGGTFQASGTFNSLSAGAHTVIVRDANACTFNINVTITQPTPLLGAVISQTDVLCFGAATGSITISGSGGTSPYQYSLDGGAYQASGTFNSLLAGAHTITVRDNKLCTTPVNFTINQPAAALTGTITAQTNVVCFGAATGSVTVSASGGTGPYQYSLDGAPYQAGGLYNGLTAGNHIVTIRDINLCITNVNVTITQPASALSGSITSQINVLCFGALTGSVTVAGSGGTAPYEYSFDGGGYQVSGTFNGLAAGVHSVTVRDAGMCTFNIPVTITQPAAILSGSITAQTNIMCFGNATGTVTVLGSGGSSPYQYRIDGGGYQVSGTFSSLIGGAHTVTVRDASFCTFDVPVTITEPASALSGGIGSQTNVICFGNSSGSVTITAAGGTTPYEFNIDGGVFQASGTFNGLLAGNHTVILRDANLCSVNIPVTITQPLSALSGSIVSQTNIACFGGSTGSVTVAGSGGTSPYEYSIDAGTYQVLGTFNTLGVGIHTVSVRDINLCTYNVIVNITQPASALAGSITSQTNILCFGGSTGTVTVSGSGGTAPYMYNIDGGVYQVSGVFNGLGTGGHTVTVRDANLCTVNVPVTITQPAAALTLSTTQVNVACFGGATGTATAIPAGGTAPYTYSWNTLPVQTTITATGLTAGTYTVTVTDANLCTATANVTITQPAAALTVGTSQVNVACFGGSTGTATAIPAGGTAPYTYSWNTLPVQTTITATGLTAGTYTVTVTDANLCTATANVTITQPAAALTIGTSQVNVACFGGATGTATAIPAGGTAPYTYSWNTLPVQTTITATGLTAGTYTVTVTDANLCTATANVTITQPAAALTIGTSQVNVACFGGATGTATAIPAGGTAPYTYSWNTLPVQTTITATGLIAGTYTVTVTDANLCTATANVTITQPAAALTVGTSQVNVACFAGATGTATAIPAGGTAPYTYSWNTLPVQTTITATGLIAGTYTVTVTDANLCTATANVTITQPAAALTVGTSQVNVACFAGATGTATAIPAGGTAPYTYSWNTLPVQTTITATGLIAGTYTVTVTDANLCTATANVTITQPAAALTIGTSQVNVACFAGATGTATAIPAGGTAPYTYSWNTLPVQTTITATGLTAGTYTVTVTDANLCTATANVTITQPAAALTIGTSQVNVACFGGSTGTATAIPAGGTAPYTYSWNTLPVQTTITATGLTAGTYTVTVTDANLCTATANVTITQLAAALTVGTSQVNVACFGGATGTATAIPAGGTAPYTYSWNTLPVQTTITATGLTAGTYTVTVTDANLCTATANVTITQPAAALTVGTSQVNVACFGGATGTATAIPAGGTAPYTYSWNTLPVQTTITATGLTAGTYAVTVTDANLCTATANVTITEPIALSVSITSQTNVSVFGGNDGSVTVAGSGGIGPYLYKLDAGTYQASGTFGTLIAGSYTVTVQDINLCTSTIPVTITQPLFSLSGSITSQTDVACFGGNTGSVTVAGSGGSLPYEYKLGAGSYQVSGTFGSLTAGSYTVTVRDAVLSTFDVPVTITQPAATLNGSTSVTNITCFGGSTGAVNLTVSGGTSPYTFLWSNGATTEDISGVTAGNYTVTITDAGGCTANASGNITQPAVALSGTTVVTNVLCFGGNTGGVNLTVSGGVSPYSFLWSNGATTEDINGVVSGNYTVTITDANGCTANASGNVTQPPAALNGSTVITNVLCNGANTGAVNLTVNGGTAPYTYLWTNGAITEDISNVVAGSYSVKVTDANGCFINQAAPVTEPARLSIEPAVVDASCPRVRDGSITLTITGGIQPYSVIWSDGITTSTRSATDSTYSVVVTDANLCTASLDIEVSFSQGSGCLNVPEVISPNGDGKNDTWIMRNIDLYPNAEVLVFNRWGQLVFRTKNIAANPWDGKYRGKFVPVDSYHYILYLNDGSKPRTGVISVIR